MIDKKKQKKNIDVGQKTSVLDSFEFARLPARDDIDIEGVYEESITHALQENSIRNIAITGPNGTGKSSIIKSFQKKHPEYKYLNISLASFDESIFEDSRESDIYPAEEKLNQDNGSVELKVARINIEHEKNKFKANEKKEKDHLIEKSILQQMIYSQHARNLNYSRFQRVIKPKIAYLAVKAVLIIILITSLYYLYQSENFFLKINPIYWNININLEWISLFIAFASTFLISLHLLVQLFQFLYKIPFKKISMSSDLTSIKGEVESSELSQESILNKHLDEILYFFEEVKCEVVVFEDLDRFQSTEIFIKLREINQLINAQRDYADQDKGEKQKPIKFVYALKDDLFIHENRVKFFDFILPIIPVINNFNSDKEIIKLFNQVKLKRKLKRKFVKELSRHIYDLRLIANIFNEFQTYSNELDLKNIDNVEAFLAVITYKNVYPADFAKLHSGAGVLANICNKRNELIEDKQNDTQKEIDNKQLLIQSANQEEVNSLQQLIYSYIGYISTKLVDINRQDNAVIVDGSSILFTSLTDPNIFNQIIDKDIRVGRNNNPYGNPIPFSHLSEQIHPGKTFQEIKLNIESKSNTAQKKIEAEIKALRREYSEIPNLLLSELLKNQDDYLTKVTEELDDPSLFIYLIKNGYLDENYHKFISRFHGATKNDIEFLINTSSLQQLKPDAQVDNPEYVCEEMNSQDFSSKNILNSSLIDYLVSSKKENDKRRIKKAVDYIAGHIKQSSEFLEYYVKHGKELEKFISYIANIHPDFIVSIADQPWAFEYISLALTFVSKNHLVTEVNKNGALKVILDHHAADVFSYGNPENLEILSDLNLEIISITELEKSKSLMDYIYEKDLYQINLDNILFLEQRISKAKKSNVFYKSNYSFVLSQIDTPLQKRIDKEFPKYVKDVLLLIGENTEEKEDAIISLLNNETISKEEKEAFLNQQNNSIKSIKSIPQDLWTFALTNNKISPNWENLEEYLNLENANKDVLDSTLNSDYSEITKAKYHERKKEDVPDGWISMTDYIFTNDKLENIAYTKLLEAMPYFWRSFPSPAVSKEKQIILINNKKVILSEQSFPVDNDEALSALLIEKGFEEYENHLDKYPLNVNHKYHLLVGGLSINYKVKIAKSLSLEEVSTLPDLAKKAGEILSDKNAELSSISYDVIKEIVSKTDRKNSVYILNKYIPQLDKNQTAAILREIPDKNYSNLTILRQKPKFPNEEPYKNFLEHLKKKEMISTGKDNKRNMLIAYPKKLD